jgi:hypothetical protein
MPAMVCITSMKHDLHRSNMQCTQPPAILQPGDRDRICFGWLNHLLA